MPKKLLVAGDLADPAVEDSETANQIEKPRWPAESINGAVLLGHSANALRLHRLEVRARECEVAGEDSGLLWRGQGTVGEGRDGFIRILFVSPELPELLRRSRGGV